MRLVEGRASNLPGTREYQLDLSKRICADVAVCVHHVDRCESGRKASPPDAARGMRIYSLFLKRVLISTTNKCIGTWFPRYNVDDVGEVVLCVLAFFGSTRVVDGTAGLAGQVLRQSSFLSLVIQTVVDGFCWRPGGQ